MSKLMSNGSDENNPQYRCECTDPLCSAHSGKVQCDQGGTVALPDIKPSFVMLCEQCADDAIAMGLVEADSLDIMNWVDSKHQWTKEQIAKLV